MFIRKLVEQGAGSAWSWLQAHRIKRELRPTAVPVQVVLREAVYDEKVNRRLRPEAELVLTHQQAIRHAGYRTSTTDTQELVLSLNQDVAKALHGALEDMFLLPMLCARAHQDPQRHNVGSCPECRAHAELRSQRWAASAETYDTIQRSPARPARRR